MGNIVMLWIIYIKLIYCKGIYCYLYASFNVQYLGQILSSLSLLLLLCNSQESHRVTKNAKIHPVASIIIHIINIKTLVLLTLTTI